MASCELTPSHVSQLADVTSFAGLVLPHYWQSKAMSIKEELRCRILSLRLGPQLWSREPRRNIEHRYD